MQHANLTGTAERVGSLSWNTDNRQSSGFGSRIPTLKAAAIAGRQNVQHEMRAVTSFVEDAYSASLFNNPRSKAVACIEGGCDCEAFST